MKTLMGALSLAALLAIAGCHTGSEGGTGATDSTTPGFTQADNTFTLAKTEVKLRQGETKQVVIPISRGKSFEDDVTLGFSELPRGVTIDPPRPMIAHGDTAARFNLIAAEGASIGDFTVKVRGHPTKGVDALNDFEITVMPRTTRE